MCLILIDSYSRDALSVIAYICYIFCLQHEIPGTHILTVADYPIRPIRMKP